MEKINVKAYYNEDEDAAKISDWPFPVYVRSWILIFALELP